MPLEKAKAMTELWQAQGDRIVFTNGCFDILHVGHVDYLEKARALGDRLVLGLNTDVSIRGLKGPERPVVGELDRAAVIASLQAVDMVVLFEEETPINLIKSLRPQVLVKGGDYTLETIVGSMFVLDLGGEVKTIPFVEGKSTSLLIKKIQGL